MSWFDDSLLLTGDRMLENCMRNPFNSMLDAYERRLPGKRRIDCRFAFFNMSPNFYSQEKRNG